MAFKVTFNRSDREPDVIQATRYYHEGDWVHFLKESAEESVQVASIQAIRVQRIDRVDD